jgi:hypothetical protein
MSCPAFRGIMSGKMSLINVTIQHGQTVEAARRRLETRVHRLSDRCGALVRRIEGPQIVIEHRKRFRRRSHKSAQCTRRRLANEGVPA